MLCTKEQLINGLTSYVDNEVIPKLPTAGKWIAGSVFALYLAKNVNQLDGLSALGVVDSNGMIDIDMLATTLKENAHKYGPIQLSYPVVGTMTFNENDIDLVRGYIK